VLNGRGGEKLRLPEENPSSPLDQAAGDDGGGVLILFSCKKVLDLGSERSVSIVTNFWFPYSPAFQNMHSGKGCI
jgi:hypothetical protein